uniref:Uncharacterized protein n=1 Tax=Arundo donax TaxID=35708 RepID=A0A0A9FK81_ARUDO
MMKIGSTGNDRHRGNIQPPVPIRCSFWDNPPFLGPGCSGRPELLPRLNSSYAAVAEVIR